MAIHERSEWTARRVEVPFDPEQPIIDAHHHLWDRPDSRYLAEELSADAAAGHNIVRTVFVECSASYDHDVEPRFAPLGETRFVAAEVERTAATGATRIGAIVGHADLMLGAAVGEVLAAHIEAGKGRFRGVRHGVYWSRHDSVKNGHHDPQEGQLAHPDFRAGVAALGDAGLSFDAWLYFDQLGGLAEMARAVPETRIVLNHLGGPLGIGPHAGDGQAEMLDVWRAGIAEVAGCENVVLKVGGIGMEHYYGMGWYDLPEPPASETVAAWWADRVHFAIDEFGPRRCLAESNFPVDRQTLPYTVLWNALQILTDRYDAAERQDLFHDTGARTYRIEGI